MSGMEPIGMAEKIFVALHKIAADHPEASPKEIGLAISAAVAGAVSYRRIPWLLQQIKKAADEKERLYFEEHGHISPPHGTQPEIIGRAIASQIATGSPGSHLSDSGSLPPQTQDNGAHEARGGAE